MFLDGILDQIDRISEKGAALEIEISSAPNVHIQGIPPTSTKYDVDIMTDKPRPGAEGSSVSFLLADCADQDSYSDMIVQLRGLLLSLHRRGYVFHVTADDSRIVGQNGMSSADFIANYAGLFARGYQAGAKLAALQRTSDSQES